MKPTIIALIPARFGSQRIKNKNIRRFDNHPLLAYSITTAIESRVFTRVIVSTDSEKYAKIAKYYGAKVPFLRPKKFATELSPDIDWVKYTLEKLFMSPSEESSRPVQRGSQHLAGGRSVKYFAILRPTSPFRGVETIRRAFKEFLVDGKADSLRAVERCRQHPAKMWIVDKEKNRMHPVIENPNKNDVSWHSQQYQTLPPIYAQNASLEIAWTRLPLKENSITGNEIMPFFTEGFEGYDINDEKDWIYAECLLANKKVKLPKIILKPYDR